MFVKKQKRSLKKEVFGKGRCLDVDMNQNQKHINSWGKSQKEVKKYSLN